ncbi:MAG: hypothetical protein JNN05_00305 [Candidatus Omnitrophica bacterium]|nr:hypothetical protein [Candidatus Omnitrophota bacterium]
MRMKGCLILSILIGLATLAVGLELSRVRPLWNDELYTQANALTSFSYSDIWKGRVVEGNNSPLFYVIQKAICDVFGFRLEQTWRGDWFVYDTKAQVDLRMLPNVCMAAALAVLFYYFSFHFSVGWALFVLLAVLSVPSTWLHWTEARPYAPWFLLTVLQSVLFLDVVRHKREGVKAWAGLAVVHTLLSLTITFGMLQAAAACLLLWMFDRRRVLPYVFLAGLPIVIGGFYYARAPKFKFWFFPDVVGLITDNVPLEFWGFFVVYLLAVIALRKEALKEPWMFLCANFFSFAGVMVAMGLSILGFLKWKAGPGPEGFSVNSRYFLFLTPVTAVSIALMLRDVSNWTKHAQPWTRVNLWLAAGGILFVRIFKTYITILASGTFTHVIR